MGARSAVDRQLRRIWLGAILALLAAGLLGSAHRAVHVGLATAPAAQLASGTGHGQGAGLFDQHDDGSDQCRLLDQLAHLDGLWVAATSADVPEPDGAPVADVAGHPVAAPARHFFARAPPRA